MIHYTDLELIEMVRDIGDSKESYEWLADKIDERFIQKNNTIANLQQRVNVAAEHTGHQLITDLVDEEY